MHAAKRHTSYSFLTFTVHLICQAGCVRGSKALLQAMRKPLPAEGSYARAVNPQNSMQAAGVAKNKNRPGTWCRAALILWYAGDGGKYAGEFILPVQQPQR